MRFLVTGGAGFIGSHLTEALLQADHEVLVLDNFSTGRQQNVAHLEGRKGFELICASVMDQPLTQDCVRSVDRVLHLASAVGVQLIIQQPVKTIETIVDGAAAVLGACARYRKPVLITSTSEVYGKSLKVPFAETDDLVIGPPTFRRWSYATAKAVDEFLALAHWHHSRLPAVIVRLFNTVGPRQSGQYGMVIPRFVHQALLGRPMTVFGDGSQTRCFCHVGDVVGALVRLLETPAAHGEVFNIGTDREISIGQLAEKIRAMTGSRSEIVCVPYQEAYGAGFEDMDRRVPDLAKVRGLIGYEPRRSLEQTLEDIIQYIRSQLESDPGVGAGE
jgi:UDP-glucose 4-epimerase